MTKGQEVSLQQLLKVPEAKDLLADLRDKKKKLEKLEVSQK